MPDYEGLEELLKRMSTPKSKETFESAVIPGLVDAWLDDYSKSAGSDDIVETAVENFSYLFDIKNGRLIAAWGISQGRHGGKRDASRMAGHPLSAGKRYHRGHAIAHTLGGGTDINLVAQLGSINIGPFRALEREAVATPGALYFTYWMYGAGDSQKPVGVQQGLLCRGEMPKLRTHKN